MSASPLARALRGSAPGLTRVVLTALLDPRRRRQVATALAHLEQMRGAIPVPGPQRHPMAPAAVRVERTRSRTRRKESEQVAVTMWFGQGPALPTPGGLSRGAVRVGAGMAGAVALAAATTLVSRLGERAPGPAASVLEPGQQPRPAPATLLPGKDA